MNIFVQPTYRDREEWTALAREEGLRFEVLEFSFPTRREAPDAAEARDWYAGCGLVSSVHGAFIDINPGSGDPLIRELTRRRSLESCEDAVFWGADQVVFHSGCFPFLREGYIEGWAEKSADLYKELSERYGLRVLVENSMDLDPTPLREIMKRCHGDAVRVCLDFGHANYSRAPLAQWFEELGPYLGCLHISDNAGLFDNHLPTGKGTVDWEEASRLTAALGRELPMTLEVGGIPEIRETLRDLRTRGLFGLS